MTRWSIPEALYDAFIDHPDLCVLPAVQELTGLHRVPWDEEDPVALWEENGTLPAIISFNRYYKNQSAEARHKALVQRANVFKQDGRDEVMAYFRRVVLRWKVRQKILACLSARGMGVYAVLKATQSRTLPEIHTIGLNMHFGGVAAHLFGEDGVWGTPPYVLPKPKVQRFVSRSVGYTWHIEKTRVARECKRLDEAVEDAQTKYKALLQGGTAHDLHEWIVQVERTVNTLKNYEDPESIATLQDLQAKAKALDVELRAPVAERKLPAPMRESLKQLAQLYEITSIYQLLADIITPANEEDDEPIAVPVSDFNLDNWESGVEQFQEWEPEELWRALGREDKQLPYFNLYEHPNGEFDPWSTEFDTWLDEQENSNDPEWRELTPRWHQLVGILKMLINTFEGRPVLLMDEVGVGKTMQVLGYIAMRAFLYEAHNAHGRYPGVFAEYNDIELSDKPFLLIVPVSLYHQMLGEIHRFFRWKLFDVYGYTGQHESRTKFWQEGWTQGGHRPHRKILLATTKAIESDGNTLYSTPQNAWQEGVRSLDGAQEEEQMSKTVFGLEWGAVICDEVQGMRTLNRFYTACRMLRNKSEMIIGMSATPGITSPMDFVAIGCFLGVDAFTAPGADEMILGIRRALGSAQRKDAIAKKNDKYVTKQLKAMLSGKTGSNTSTLSASGAFAQVVQLYMDDFRRKYADVVIRRTVNSKDYRGEPISGLPPYKEQVVMCVLSEDEHETFREVVQALAEKAESAKGIRGAHFYLAQRRCLTHPSTLGPGHGWTAPKSGRDFDKKPTAKLHVLRELIRHHLGKRKATPLMNANGLETDRSKYPAWPDSNKLVKVKDFKYEVYAKGPPEKIVVYSAFPSNNDVILRVLRDAGIKVEVLNGHHSMKQRHVILKRFHDAGPDGARVLLMSAVGTVGLNITCAHIVIFLDTTWSAQDDNQTIGRVWRIGQTRQVLVYRLIAIGSPDVFLNTIAFGKGFMHAAFVKSDAVVRRMFADVAGEDLDDDDLLPEPEMETDPEFEDFDIEEYWDDDLEDLERKGKKPAATPKRAATIVPRATKGTKTTPARGGASGRTPSTSMSRTSSTSASEPPSTSVSRTASTSVSRTASTSVSRTASTSASRTPSRTPSRTASTSAPKVTPTSAPTTSRPKPRPAYIGQSASAHPAAADVDMNEDASRARPSPAGAKGKQRAAPPPRSALKPASSKAPAANAPVVTPTARATPKANLKPAPMVTTKRVSTAIRHAPARSEFIDDEASEGEESTSDSAEVEQTPSEDSEDEYSVEEETLARQPPSRSRRVSFDDDGSDEDSSDEGSKGAQTGTSRQESSSEEDESEEDSESSEQSDDSGEEEASSRVPYALAVTPPQQRSKATSKPAGSVIEISSSDDNDDGHNDVRMQPSSPIAIHLLSPQRHAAAPMSSPFRFDNRELQSPTRPSRSSGSARISDVRSTFGGLKVISSEDQAAPLRDDFMQVDDTQPANDYDPFRMESSSPPPAPATVATPDAETSRSARSAGKQRARDFGPERRDVTPPPVAGPSRSTGGADPERGNDSGTQRRRSHDSPPMKKRRSGPRPSASSLLDQIESKPLGSAKEVRKNLRRR